ncbi:hypothetical protein [Streptomyces sp. NPDC048057]|uniref:hypothetical protein n=1 Tax=Streptomyces sp. NPDC048057 TaxID=3155628 RepID=UPI0033F99B1D
MTYIYPASQSEYTAALGLARSESERISRATSAPEEMPGDARYYLTADLQSGFGVAADGALIGLFSTVQGRGDDLITDAVTHKGATHLDCFDGYLPGLYKRHGFIETERVPNWVSGEPDVVFMALR